MTTPEQYRLNAANCAHMAESAENEPDKNRFKRMAAAEEQDWLDGKSSADPAGGLKAKGNEKQNRDER